MRKILIIAFLIHLTAFPQSTSFDFHSPLNIKLFADHLYCEGDYLRAIEQYEFIENKFVDDTIDFKIMLSYSNLGLYEQSNKFFQRIHSESAFYNESYLLSVKNEFIYNSKPIEHPGLQSFDSTQSISFKRLSTVSMLYGSERALTKSDFISNFDTDQQKTVSMFYDYKFDPPYKSPVLAGIFSTIIPGSGKMYVGEWGDGITGLLITGLFAFLAYDNFRADHTTRAWIFTGLGAFFYAGNIYGSISSAHIFNARIDFEFQNGLKLFLEKENYFLRTYDFCN